MKHLLLFILVLPVITNAQQVLTMGNVQWNKYQDSLQKSKDSLCKQRGHLFEQVKEESNLSTYYSGSLTTGYTLTSYYDTCSNILIDATDSSYIVRRLPPEVKYCYRCGKNIEFPKPEQFIKTIWRRKP